MSARWEPPPTVDESWFEEHELVLSAEPGDVGATLTLPLRSDGPARPGAVLLAGGGPFDRDETSGPNKPLKDLAWGLAARGVAVLRFDKVGFTRPETRDAPGFTMSAEYVPHALAAVRLLRAHAERVFVVGHSMGGKVAPLVAASDPGLAGLVIMAGDTQPMHHALVRVARHLARVAPEMMTAAMVEAFTEQAAVVDGPELSEATPASLLPFHAPASYWLQQRDYDPAATAAALPQPLLILQGGRDYQVTVADDLPGWQRGLRTHHDTTVRIVPAADHLFFAGAAPSTPADYTVPGHMDPDLITDIAEWIHRRACARPSS